MTRNRTMLPFAVTLLAMVGLPAAAAELDGVADGASLTDAIEAPSADAASPSEDSDRAERRSSKSGSKGKSARSGGKSQSAGKARTGGSAQRPSSAKAPARATSSSSRTIRAPSANTPARQSSARPAASNTRSAPARAATSTRGGDTRNASTARNSNSRGGNSHNGSGHQAKPGTNHQQAGNGPRAANTVQRPANSTARRGNGTAHKPNRGNNAKRGPKHVVRHNRGVPGRWSPNYHRYHLKGVHRGTPRYWATGVFIYNAPPKRHRVVVVDGGGDRIKGADPGRAVDRNNSFAIGMKGGSYMSGYTDGGGYGDLGLGLDLRYRPVESVGLELSWMHHSDTWDDHAERATDPISASVQLFAFPWSRVSPYAAVGLTVTAREAQDTYYNGLENVEYQANDALFGPHAGLGIEFAIGQSAALGFEGKYVGYVDRQDGDTALPGAFQGNMGLNFYF